MKQAQHGRPRDFVPFGNHRPFGLGTVVQWVFPQGTSWDAARDALVHYQFAARLNEFRKQHDQGKAAFAFENGLDRSAFSAACNGRVGWPLRLVALAADLGPLALPERVALARLLAEARRQFHAAGPGGAFDASSGRLTAELTMPWPPLPSLPSIAFETGSSLAPANAGPSSAGHGRGHGHNGEQATGSGASPEGFRVMSAPPPGEWTEQDLADQKALIAVFRGPITEYANRLRENSPLMDEAERPRQVELEIDVQLLRAHGDQWRGGESSLDLIVDGQFMVVWGTLRQAWQWTVLDAGWAGLGGSFVCEVRAVDQSRPDRRPIRVTALRPYDDGGELRLVTLPADVIWDEDGTATLHWDMTGIDLGGIRPL